MARVTAVMSDELASQSNVNSGWKALKYDSTEAHNILLQED